MPTSRHANNIHPMKMSNRSLQRLIAKTAADSSKVIFTAHAKQRMRERKITPIEVLRCLREGMISEPAHQNIHGHWQCRLTKTCSGVKLDVAAALYQTDAKTSVVVITAF